MNVKQFVEAYKVTTKSKEDYAKKHIVKQYLPYAEKIAMGARIINISLYAGDEVKVFKMNTPVKTMFLNLAVVSAYSDIDCEFTVDEYDMLVESGAMQHLLSAIPQSEIDACVSMVDAMIADELENTRNVVSFFETKIGALRATFDSLLEVMENLDLPIKENEIVDDGK